MSCESAVLESVDIARAALEDNAEAKWIVGYSGGKDSTALLKVLLAAARGARRVPSWLRVIYCDTGVENPVLDAYVKGALRRLDQEFLELGLPFRVSVLRAPPENSFFVKIIGRGYPPPTNSFRWCTKNLRIRPVSDFIHKVADENAIVALGLRGDESQQRDRSIASNGGGVWQRQREAKTRHRIFLPLLNLTISDVWDVNFMFGRPFAFAAKDLERLYRDASGECPILKSPAAAPCASGRFGCWTCTVVRKDRSATKLVQAGHIELRPYLEFRNWLAQFRNDTSQRWSKRRSGAPGAGPFTLEARRTILERLTVLEEYTGASILSAEERARIEYLWSLDEDREPAALNSALGSALAAARR